MVPCCRRRPGKRGERIRAGPIARVVEIEHEYEYEDEYEDEYEYEYEDEYEDEHQHEHQHEHVHVHVHEYLHGYEYAYDYHHEYDLEQPAGRRADTARMLDYEKLDVYRCALELAELALKLAAHLPRGHTALADQLRRAASAIPLRIAEASGRTSAAERSHHYAEARGEAMECGAALDLIRILGGTPADVERGKLLVKRLVEMLTKMCR